MLNKWANKRYFGQIFKGNYLKQKELSTYYGICDKCRNETHAERTPG